MQSRALFLGLLWDLAGLGLTAPARADLQFCNKTSYVLDLALGLEEKGAAATRGWFRVEPGQCKSVMQGTPDAEKVYVHARALAAYGPSPLPQAGHADLCIADSNFIIAAAKACNSRSGQRLMRFSEIKPSQTEQGLTAYLGEEADYDPGAGAARRRATPAGDRGLRRQPDRRTGRQENRRGARPVSEGSPPPGRDRERRDVLPGVARCREGSRRARLLVVQRDARSP